MTSIRLHFHQELNDFLLPALRHAVIVHNLERRASVKDVIESFGVPHTEVELILNKGVSVDFAYIVQEDDDIGVYSSVEGFDGAYISQLRPEPSRSVKFVVDANLGKLSRYLRLLGFDCLYGNNYSDEEVAKITHDQQRTVLTRDRRLLHRKIITYGYFVRATLPKVQIKEVLQKFDLFHLVEPLTRCAHCNGKLVETDKQEIEYRLEPRTKQYYNKFLVCSGCNQIYWSGSHCLHVKYWLDEFIGLKIKC